MLTRLQLVVLGIVVVHGTYSNAMEKKPESPRNLLSCSVELRKKTAAMQISTSKNHATAGSWYYKHCGHSPIESWIPFSDHSGDGHFCGRYDCP